MAMIMAIAFLVIIAGMLATMLNMTATTSKRTEHVYFTEQAQLLAKSATEFALLAISGHDRVATGTCVDSTTSTFPAANPYFNINTTIRHIGMGGICPNNNYIPIINTQQSRGTVLIDVYVSSIDANLNIGETIRYHRRTIQKP